MTITVTFNAKALLLMRRRVRYYFHVAVIAALARKAGVARRTRASLDGTVILVFAQFPRLQDGVLQHSFDLICVEGCSEQDVLDVRQNAEELGPTDRVPFVFGPSQASYDIFDVGRHVVPFILVQLYLESCIFADELIVAECDFHPVGPDENDVRSGGGFSARVPSHHQPMDRKSQQRAVALQFVAQIFFGSQPVEGLDVGDFVIPNDPSARVRIPGRSYDVRN